MTGPRLLMRGQRVTTDSTLRQDLSDSLTQNGVAPHTPTLREWLMAVLAHGVTYGDHIDAIEFRNESGKVFVERENGTVRIGEKA